MSESLSAEAIKEIERLVLASRRTEIVADPGNPKAYYIVRPDGITDSEEHSIGPHRETHQTIESFNRFISEPPGGKCPHSEVWVSPQDVSYVFNNGDRRDRAIFPLKQSDQMKWMLAYGGKPMRQSEIVRAIRIVFRSWSRDCPNLLTVLRQLKFTANGATEGSLSHAEESLGRSLIAAVTGSGAIPENVCIVFPFFSNLRYTVTVDCAIEISPSEQTFAITPVPGELIRVENQALEEIFDLIEHDRIFIGSCPVPW